MSDIEDENKHLKEELRNMTKKHNDTVEYLEELLALALNRANMTLEELKQLKEKEDNEAIENSAWAMARGAYK